jgi:hypothetical protein
MIFLIVENLLLTTNIEELRENSDRPTTIKDGEYCTGVITSINHARFAHSWVDEKGQFDSNEHVSSKSVHRYNSNIVCS